MAAEVKAGSSGFAVACTLSALLGAFPFALWVISPDLIFTDPGGDSLVWARMLHISTDVRPFGLNSQVAKIAAYSLISLSAVISGSIGVIAAWFGKKDGATRAFASFLCCLPLALGAEYLAVPYPSSNPLPILPPWAIASLGGAAFGISFLSLLRFSIRFPSPLSKEHLSDYFDAMPRTRWRPEKIHSDNKKNAIGFTRFFESDRATAIVILAFVAAKLFSAAAYYMVVVCGAFGSVIGGYLFFKIGLKVRPEEQKGRILWVYGGISASIWTLSLIGMLPFALAILVGDQGYALYTVLLLGYAPFVTLTVLILGLALSVFYHGALDPRLAIRKTTVYGGMGFLFLFLFAALGNVVEGMVEGALGLSNSVGAGLTGGVAALAVIPVKKRLDGFVGRILPATVLAEAPTQTVAILFSDIVGYTRLTGEDQKTALTMMTVFHKTGDRIARQHRGRFVKAVADEVMLEFKDPSNAVSAASGLRDEFHEAAGELGLPTPEIRTGVHFGKVTRSADGDLFGDAVNIASRIQGLAEPGQVLLSAAISERLSGPANVESLGQKELKNVVDPIEVFKVVEQPVQG